MLAGRASSMFAWWLLRVGYALCMLFIYSMFARRLLDRVNGVVHYLHIDAILLTYLEITCNWQKASGNKLIISVKPAFLASMVNSLIWLVVPCSSPWPQALTLDALPSRTSSLNGELAMCSPSLSTFTRCSPTSFGENKIPARYTQTVACLVV